MLKFKSHAKYVFKFCIYFELHWVLVSAHGLSLVVASRGLLSSCGTWASHRGVFLHCTAWALELVGSLVAACRLWRIGSVVLAHMLSCPKACGVFLEQGSSSCSLHWQWILNHWMTREIPSVKYFQKDIIVLFIL